MEVAHHIDDSSPEAQQGLDDLLKGRDVKWYKGRYLRLNLILVRSMCATRFVHPALTLWPASSFLL
jgi:hypothetical protein